ncbi:diadenosine tetraphosphate hydrolase [Dactylosporangium sp. NPDC005555]|uniref:diadenosine tetraphosphate hydrolase n=1 Tax=Dactylosporangium sp. NPDC005555 TaxID=3154889 RepID=UPI0033BBCFC4
MDDWRKDRIRSALEGRNPTVLARLASGFVVMGDTQFLPGYCVLLTDDPSADRLADLPRGRRLQFLADLDLVGEAVQTVCERRDPQFRRVNYMVLGNLDPVLHGHVHPRYEWEPPELQHGPVTHYPMAERMAVPLGPEHDTLRADLAAEIVRLSTEYDELARAPEDFPGL